MTKTFFADDVSLISPPWSRRTVKYIEALTREGDNFDYHQWLKSVREEEAQANQDQTAITSGNVVVAQADNSINRLDNAKPNLGPAPIFKPGLNLKTARQPHHQPNSQTPKARLRRWLEKVRRASGECQASRRRDAVYEYLAAVFAIVMHYKVRRRTTRLLRQAFEFANLPFEQNADAFTAVLRCACGNAVDAKTISKYARALRYARRRKQPDMKLKTFMKEAGGVNACASLYAKHFGRSNRVAAI